MKNIIISLMLIFLTQTLSAAEVCHSIPEEFGYDQVYTNFDGSMTLINPTLYGEGTKLRIDYDTARYDGLIYNAGTTVCKMLKKVYVSTLEALNSKDDLLVQIDVKGNFYQTNRGNYYLHKVTCK